MDPLSSRSAYPDFRRVGGQLRLPPLTNRFRYICPVVSDCAAGQRNWLMYSGRFAMLTPDNVWLAVKPVDMRAGIDTLTQYVQNELNAAWHDGAAFVFTNKARSRIKVLRWDKHGVWLCTRRLHRGSFRWPRKGDATWHLTPDEFHWLVCGVDWPQVKGHDLAKWVYREPPPDAQHITVTT